jgi:type IV pilus secretin PilQ/predicted competence protein
MNLKIYLLYAASLLIVLDSCASSDSQNQSQEVTDQGLDDASIDQTNGNLNANMSAPTQQNAVSANNVSMAKNSGENNVFNTSNATANMVGNNQGAANQNLAASINNVPSTVEDLSSQVINTASPNVASTGNTAAVNGASNQTIEPVQGEATPGPATGVAQTVPQTHEGGYGIVTWVGYNYSRVGRQLDVQMITQGHPTYRVFQTTNRFKQKEIVVRFMNAKVRGKIKRDLDASEFLSPVSYVRVRRDEVYNHADVILTLREDVTPKLFAKGSHVMLTFPISDKWYDPKTAMMRPVAKATINSLQDAEAGSGLSVEASQGIHAYVDDPGRAVFGASSAAMAKPLAPVGDSGELRPTIESDESDVSPTPVSVPPSNNSLQPQQNTVPQWQGGFMRPARREHLAALLWSIVSFVTLTSEAQAQPAENTQLQPVQNTGTTTELIGTDPASSVQQSAAVPKRVMKFDFRNASIASVMRAIAEEAGINFVMTPEISAMKVTVSINNVPWDVALRAVLETNRLGMEEIGPKIVRIDRLKTFVDDREAQMHAKQATAALVPTKTMFFKLSYALAEDVAKLVKEMLPKPENTHDVESKRNFERFKVNPDKRSNSVIVEATPHEIAKVKALIERLDTQTPQVKIASRIVEVISSFEQSFGINWGSPFSSNAGYGTGFGALPFPNTLSSTFAVDPIFTGTPTGAAQMRLGSINSAIALDLTIKALESRNEAESLQNQDVIVEDNGTADIVAGQTDYFTIPAQGTAVSSLTEVQYNTSLKVTPHITADGAVQMKIEITGDKPLASTKLNGQAGKTTRRIATTLLRKSGDTAVIGGLYSTDRNKIESAVPLLGRIPILGALFRSTSSVDQKRDLLIMLTPTIQSGVISTDGPGSGSQTANYIETPPAVTDEVAQPSEGSQQNANGSVLNMNGATNGAANSQNGAGNTVGNFEGSNAATEGGDE